MLRPTSSRRWPVPFSRIDMRPYPDWGFVDGEFMLGYSNYYGVETSFPRRFANRWQLAATCTLAALRDSLGDPCQIVQTADGSPVCNEITFPLQRDIGGEYTLAATDQRHRAVFNGIWEVGMGFQLSGLYFFGSGMRTGVSCNCESLDTGSGGDTRRLDDGTFLERNSFVGHPIHRIDTRLQKRFALGPRMTIDGMLEVFNLFDRANFGSYTTNIHDANFGRPTYNSNVAYASRAAQLGFRLAF